MKRRTTLVLLGLLASGAGLLIGTRAVALSPPGHFVVSADTVVDSRTSLMWQRDVAPNTALTWLEALAYCDGLSLAGYSDWRLPTIKELATIIDESLMLPAVEAQVFSGLNGYETWSSTPMASAPQFAWSMHLGFGLTVPQSTSNGYRARCVR